MRPLCSILLMAVLSMFTSAALSLALCPPDGLPNTSGNNKKQLCEENRNEVRQLIHDTKAAAGDIEILRRDQINYRIEKDILKEAYATSLQGVNVTITIVVSVFGLIAALFGYIGFRSIREIKDDYTTELGKLIKIKTEVEAELHSLTDKLKTFETKVSELAKTNVEQNTRLQVLELTEKVATYISQNQWSWALHWISAGLAIEPKNIILISQKATCHGKLGELTAAIESLKSALEIEPHNYSRVWDLLELLALSNQADEFDKTYEQFKAEVDNKFEGNLTLYFKVLLNYIKGDFDQTANLLNRLVDKYPGEARKLLDRWAFDEAITIISKQPEGKHKSLILGAIKFFQGQIKADELKVLLQAP